MEYYTTDYIHKHTDGAVENHSTYRINFVTQKAKRGGNFVGKTLLNICDRIFLFRPDIDEHEVLEVFEGKRKVFVFTFLLKRT